MLGESQGGLFLLHHSPVVPVVDTMDNNSHPLVCLESKFHSVVILPLPT